MPDIDNQFSIAGIQFSILVLPQNNFERYFKEENLGLFLTAVMTISNYNLRKDNSVFDTI